MTDPHAAGNPPETSASKAGAMERAVVPRRGRAATVVQTLVGITACFVVGMAAASLPAAVRKLVLLPGLLGAAAGAIAIAKGRLFERPVPLGVVLLLPVVAMAGYAIAGVNRLQSEKTIAEARAARDNPAAALFLGELEADGTLDPPSPVVQWLTWRVRSLGDWSTAAAAAWLLMEFALAVAVGVFVVRQFAPADGSPDEAETR